jgi:hypothetical protein
MAATRKFSDCDIATHQDVRPNLDFEGSRCGISRKTTKDGNFQSPPVVQPRGFSAAKRHTCHMQVRSTVSLPKKGKAYRLLMQGNSRCAHGTHLFHTGGEVLCRTTSIVTMGGRASRSNSRCRRTSAVYEQTQVPRAVTWSTMSFYDLCNIDRSRL